MIGDMIGLAGVDPSLLPIARIGAIYQNFMELHSLKKFTHRDTGIMLKAEYIHLHGLGHRVKPFTAREEENSKRVKVQKIALFGQSGTGIDIGIQWNYLVFNMLLANMIMDVECVSVGVILRRGVEKENATGAGITFNGAHFLDGIKGELVEIF